MTCGAPPLPGGAGTSSARSALVDEGSCPVAASTSATASSSRRQAAVRISLTRLEGDTVEAFLLHLRKLKVCRSVNLLSLFFSSFFLRSERDERHRTAARERRGTASGHRTYA